MRTAVTVSLVREARGGPFVFWDDLPSACREAADIGFDAIELFAPGPDAVEPAELTRLLTENKLGLAAVGTGAGWVIQRLTLTSSEAAVRGRAKDFIRSMITFGAQWKAPAIIGSMQGRRSDNIPREQSIAWLREALNELGAHAESLGVPLIYEPLNRYETDLVNTMADGVALLESLETKNVRILADLFHMNIEEHHAGNALRTLGEHLGHVHFVDSNRRPAGCGQLNYGPIVEALRDIGYEGYLSAEALPYPSSAEAAALTMAAYQRLFAN